MKSGNKTKPTTTIDTSNQLLNLRLTFRVRVASMEVVNGEKNISKSCSP